MPKFFLHRDEYINIDRVVRVKRQIDTFTLCWLDENNKPQEIVLRKDQWETMRRDLAL